MGLVFSAGFVAQNPNPGLEEIPESCLALVLAHFDPPEICKLGRVNRSFYRASLSDSVWESKLPENYQILLNKLFDTDHDHGTNYGSSDQGLTKKDIYARLCCNNGFDGGTKVVWMEKRKGGICVSVSWKGMKITGIDDRRYWRHIPTDESRLDFFLKLFLLLYIHYLFVNFLLFFSFLLALRRHGKDIFSFFLFFIHFLLSNILFLIITPLFRLCVAIYTLQFY